MQSRAFSWVWKGFPALMLAAMSLAAAQGQDLKSFEQRITTKVLPNGLTLIVCERPEAPVFSYSTFIDAGDVNDPVGRERPGAHVRASGIQGHQRRSAPRTTPPRRLRWPRWRRPTTPTRPSI